MNLCAKEVKKVFARQGRGGEFCALSPTDLTLTAGHLVEITGRSGSGKSTLLQILGGLLQPTAGQVLLDDRDLYALEDGALSRLRNRHIGIIPQGHTALRSLSVAENVILPARLYAEGAAGEAPFDEAACKARAAALLDMVGIGDLAEEEPTQLSGGELRRVAIARALMRQPAILLADEPTGDLDDENTARVLKLLRQYADDGAAVLLVTHEGAAAAYADTVYEMSAGVLRLAGAEKARPSPQPQGCILFRGRGQK